MNDLISIIIPIYNVEKYLKKCLLSIVEQTYKNIEVILIDDGSTDSSSKICDEFCKNNKNFFVYHKKNEGVSKARNFGINKAKGDYLIFIDSDDTISKDMIEILYKNIIEENADISMCNVVRVDEKGEYIDSFDKNRKEEVKKSILNRSDYIANILDYKYYFTYATNKLIKKKIVYNIRFREDIYYNEDGIFFLDLSKNIDKAVYIGPVDFYFYLKNSNSANAQSFNERYLTVLKSFEIMEEYFNVFNNKNKCYFSYRYINYAIEANYYLYKNKSGQIKKYLRNIERKYFKYAIRSDNISKTKKIKFVLKILFPVKMMKLKYNSNK